MKVVTFDSVRCYCGVVCGCDDTKVAARSERKQNILYKMSKTFSVALYNILLSCYTVETLNKRDTRNKMKM